LEEGGESRLPFAWSDVSLHAPGASELRATIELRGEEGISLRAADASGAPVLAIGALALRPVDRTRLSGHDAPEHSLSEVQWSEVPLGDPGAEPFDLQGDLAPLIDAFAESLPPSTVLWRLPSSLLDQEGPARAREALELTLELLQDWLAEERLAASRLAVVTEGAIAAGPGEDPDLPAASVWGLLRSAQSENPERFVLIDTDGSEASEAALPAALGIEDEPQLALREGVALAARLAPLAARGGELVPPPGPWRLDSVNRGTLDSLALLSAEDAEEPLGPTAVRVAVRAAGINFRDVLIALGLYPGEAAIGTEGAGVVLEAGAEVSDLQPGDPVTGFLAPAFAPTAIAERGLLAPIPREWSFEQAAAIPSVFLTARFGLGDLAGLQAGEKILIHAGAGGVGMAAIQLAQRLGAEVFATASPGKWDVLREAGLAEDHIASSRELGFRQKFLEVTGGEGVDVVLNSLAGEFADASLELLPRGGRFLEMGKTDIRDGEQVAKDHPGVAYRAFELGEAGPERMAQMLTETIELLSQGALNHSPTTSWDVRRAPEAFRHLREGKNVGKVVLTIPRPIDPDATVLITGATGTLGALTARHLAEAHGARHLLLVSRSGEEAPGARELREELEEQGAEVTIAACDVSQRPALEQLFASIPAEHPLGAIVHAAGALDDATIDSLSAERFAHVFAPKADAAWHLHELSAGLDLSAFVLFSSAAGTLGSPGQGNYAAASSFLDALAVHRQAQGLAATSIAWGYWESVSALTAKLEEADLARMRRSGMEAISDQAGLALFDAALLGGSAATLAAPLRRSSLRSLAAAGMLAPLMRGLVSAPAKRRRASSGALAAKLAALPEAEREPFVLDLVRTEAAAVLGHGSAEAVDPDRAFKELGFDSLAAVELRNRLGANTGLRLAPTLIFDYPSSRQLSGYLLGELELKEKGLAEAELAELERALASASSSDPGRTKVATHLRALAANLEGEETAASPERERLESATDDELLEFVDEQMGRGPNGR
jgi:NADPH:quinone reductase-like Zn-dependent oxidoreductase/acyl carrier protein